MAKNRHPEREPGVRRRGYTIVIALAFFVCLGGLPAILSALHLKINAAPPTSSDGIKLLGAPQALQAVPLPPVARPVDPTLPTATFPSVSESQEAAAVGSEDNRLRAMLHDSFRTSQPTIEHYGHALPTLVLPSGRHFSYSGGTKVLVSGQSTYTVADLIRYGAMARLPNGSTLLEDNVFVSDGARLVLTSQAVPAIYLDITPRGAASIVGWGGSLVFQGTSRVPLTIEGWDEGTMTPARDIGRGRPYIREVAGRMTLANARVSYLGFWSGRTGGVAWTGLATHPSYGGTLATTFTGNTYGAFVTRGHDVRFLFDLFESSQLDGLHIHRGTIGASASYSAAVRNGGNGFHVDRATQKTILVHDLSQHNGTNGFLADGRPLVSTASASGNGVAPGSGTRIEYSDALQNGRTGILIEGGNRTVLKADEVCARRTGIALRYGASNAIVDGNDVRCGPRTGLSIGPLAPGALVFGNAVSGARIAILVTSSGDVEVDKSLITLASVFGISARGASSVVFGKDNVISGIGFRAVNAGPDARSPALSGSNTADWAYARKGTVLSYLEFHPLALMWLSIAFLVIAGGLWTRRRRAPTHPYPESTRWFESAEVLGPAPVPLGATAGAQAGLAAVGAQVSPGPGAAPAGLTAAGAPYGLAPAGVPFGLAVADEQVGAAPAGLAAHGAQAGLAVQGAHAGLAAHGAQVSPAAGAAPVARTPGGAPADPLWSPRHDAWPGDVSPYRGPFEAALPDAAGVDGGYLDAARLDDGGALGRRRPEDTRLESPRLDGARRHGARRDGDPLDPGRLDGGRPDGRRRDPGRPDSARRDGIRLDPLGLDSRYVDPGRPDSGRRDGIRLDPLGLDSRYVDPGPPDGGRRDAGRRDPGRPASDRSDSRRGDGSLNGGRHDPVRLDSARWDGGRPDPLPRNGGRPDPLPRNGGRPDPSPPASGRPDPLPGNGGRPDPLPRNGGRPDPLPRNGGRPDPSPPASGRPDPSPPDSRRRDQVRRDDGRPDPLPLDPAQADPARLDDARPYVGHPDGNRQLSRHGRSEPLDSTKPLPQVGDRQ